MPRLPLLMVLRAAPVLALVSFACGEASLPPYEIASPQKMDVPAANPAQPGIDRPSFDPKGTLRWEARPAAVSGACPAGTPMSGQKTWLLAPRVDEVRCGAAGGPAQSSLFGIDPAGIVVWRRALGFRSGEYTVDQLVLGAAAEGIVLSDLTVLAPATGAIVLPPKTHPVGAEKRPIPDVALTGAALYLPREQAFLHFAADVTLLHSEGGLFRIDGRTAKRELLLPVATTLLRGYWRVESMALSADGKNVFLGEKLAIRGEGGVAFSVLDLAARKVVFRRTFDEDQFCSDPAIVLGPHGRIGFFYKNDTAGKRLLIEIRPRGGK